MLYPAQTGFSRELIPMTSARIEAGVCLTMLTFHGRALGFAGVRTQPARSIPAQAIHTNNTCPVAGRKLRAIDFLKTLFFFLVITYANGVNSKLLSALCTGCP